MSEHDFKADVIVVGAGLAGMVATHEAVLRGRRVLLLDQEAPQSLGGQAFWSLGGLFMVDTPEQRRLGIRDSAELALSDWMGSAQFDREEDANPAPVPKISSTGRRATCAGGVTIWACAGSLSWAGPNGAAPWRAGTATPFRGFTSPGAPGPGWSDPSSG